MRDDVPPDRRPSASYPEGALGGGRARLQLRAREARKPVANSIQKRSVAPVVDCDVVGPEQIFFEGVPFLRGEAVIEDVQVGLGVQSK